MRAWRTRGIVLPAAFCLLAFWAVLPLGACSPNTEAPGAEELHVLNWEDYFAPDAVENFESESGIRVTVETFNSEEEMLSKLQSRPGYYDVVVSSGSMVQTLQQLRLLSSLDLARIPNFANIGEQFRGLPFDVENRYSVPYLWGTTGLALNTSYVTETDSSWEVLWEPAYGGHLAMLNDLQEVAAVALLTSRYSLNTREPAHLEAAEQKLLEQRPLLAGYLDPISIIEGLVSEELWAAQIYSGDAFTAAEDNPNIIYVIPSEGAALWVDNLVIPAGAPRKEEAETFINYILQPEVAGATVNYLYYATPNQTATPHIDQEILDDPSVYPEPETLSRLEYYQPLDEATNQRLNRIWATLLKP